MVATLQSNFKNAFLELLATFKYQNVEVACAEGGRGREGGVAKTVENL